MTDDLLRDAVARLIARATCTSGTLVVGSDEWWAAPATVQLGCVAALGLDHIPPAAPDKQASVAISNAVDWAAEAEVPSYAELARRRAQPGPLTWLSQFDPDAVRRWVETGHCEQGGGAAA